MIEVIYFWSAKEMKMVTKKKTLALVNYIKIEERKSRSIPLVFPGLCFIDSCTYFTPNKKNKING